MPGETSAARRLRGAYYTPQDIARWLAGWAIRHGEDRVLEPSFGDGAFLRAAAHRLTGLGAEAGAITGVELDGPAMAAAVAAGLLPPERAVHRDFLAVQPFPVDAVLGNPPFVRLRNLPAAARRRGLARAEEALGAPMELSGSLWMPFLLHAVRFLAPGGRLALVLPFELTHVRYARPVWRWLAGRFGSIRLIRLHQRVFDDILQDVVLLLAEDHGRSTGSVDFGAYLSVERFFADLAAAREKIQVSEIEGRNKPFVRALLPEELRGLLAGALRERTTPVRELADFGIGYVSGDKEFFHPGAEAVREYGIPAAHLRPAMLNTRALRGAGLYTSRVAQRPDVARLFLPEEPLSEGERRYVDRGERAGVARRYKCRIRSPWWRVPGVLVPDLVLSVFSDTPRLLINDGAAVASNSLLCGRLRAGTADGFAAAWYTSLTLLECEINVHALGGGVLVLIPGETASIRLPPLDGLAGEHGRALDEALRTGAAGDPYLLGDRYVLGARLGLPEHAVELIREGVATLRRWRQLPVG